MCYANCKMQFYITTWPNIFFCICKLLTKTNVPFNLQPTLTLILWCLQDCKFQIISGWWEGGRAGQTRNYVTLRHERQLMPYLPSHQTAYFSLDLHFQISLHIMSPFFKDNALKNNFLKSSNACHYFPGDPALSLCNLVPKKCKFFEGFYQCK
jgi:hypothetical protein